MLVYFTIVFASLMAWVSRAKGGDYYLLSVFAALVTVILYAITLIFSHAGKRPWLKTGGVLTREFCKVPLTPLEGRLQSEEIPRLYSLTNRITCPPPGANFKVRTSVLLTVRICFVR